MKQRDDPEVNAWMTKASQDLEAAGVVSRYAPHLASVGGFHC